MNCWVSFSINLSNESLPGLWYDRPLTLGTWPLTHWHLTTDTWHLTQSCDRSLPTLVHNTLTTQGVIGCQQILLWLATSRDPPSVQYGSNLNGSFWMIPFKTTIHILSFIRKCWIDFSWKFECIVYLRPTTIWHQALNTEFLHHKRILYSLCRIPNFMSEHFYRIKKKISIIMFHLNQMWF